MKRETMSEANRLDSLIASAKLHQEKMLKTKRVNEDKCSLYFGEEGDSYHSIKLHDETLPMNIKDFYEMYMMKLDAYIAGLEAELAAL